MAGVRQLGWKAIPAVRSGYGADTLPDRYRSDVTNGAIVIHTQRLKSDPGGNLLS